MDDISIQFSDRLARGSKPGRRMLLAAAGVLSLVTLAGAADPALEQQLSQLQACGFDFEPQEVLAVLIEELEHADHEQVPWDDVLYSLGADIGDAELGGSLVAGLWHLDMEYIEDHGDYALVARGFARLAGGALPLTDIRDHVDLEAGEAWVAFHLHGSEHHWNAVVRDDWLDPAIMSGFVTLLQEQDSPHRYAIHAEGGQDVLLAGTTEAGLACLRGLTGMHFEWLE